MSSPSWFRQYDINTERSLTQGLILPELEVLNPQKITSPAIFHQESAKMPFHAKDFIILTQSCDLLKSTLKHVHICPIFTLDELIDMHSTEFDEDFTVADFFEQLRTGQRVAKYMTNKVNLKKFIKYHDKFLVVKFDQTMIVSQEFIRNYFELRGQRYYPCLNPPYREAMAQNYGKYFMRVGNPVDYDSFPTELERVITDL